MPDTKGAAVGLQFSLAHVHLVGGPVGKDPVPGLVSGPRAARRLQPGIVLAEHGIDIHDDTPVFQPPVHHQLADVEF
jgi:hypothetical protein